MKRVVKKVVVWTLALVIGLPAFLYAVLVAINWRDRDPSPLTIKLMAEYRANSIISVDDNGYVDLMGFAVPPGEDPHSMGLKRVEWMSTLNEVGAAKAGPDPQAHEYDFKSQRDPKVQTISNACNRDSHGRLVGVECLNALNDMEMLKRWIASEAWLLERYQRLIARSTWVDEVPLDLSVQLPSYSLVMEGQKLLLAKAMILAKENRPSEMQQLLASDHRFWRHVLSSTNLLITRMIATVALDRHFAMANIAIRQVPPDGQQKAIPEGWRQPISDEEKSLHKVMIGEWVFASSVLKNNDSLQRSEAEGVWGNDNKTAKQLFMRLAKPLHNLQDTINSYAECYLRVADAVDVSYKELPAAMLNLDAEMNSKFSGTLSFRSVYNPMGKILVAIAAPYFATYGRRVADIEGVRRATLTAIELRESGVGPDQAAAALQQSTQRNPFSDDPFVWDEKEKVIVFTGLELGERGEHHIYY